ncbi:MAG: hypothetical protein K6F53_03700 [Lachnospiraceae bacterium]|nr:hypothetical protein [Lachnospiraceae bacterium]
MEYRAFFINIFGKRFSKDFGNSEEMDAFIAIANEAGTRLLGFVSL